jgi:cyclopropane fatty-acyl-phospholipid synthase-like methyltransferase
MSKRSAKNQKVNQSQSAGEVRYYKRDFWGVENLKYAEPHFRMRKVARVVRRLARGRECDLLDVGCGPGTLGRILPANVRYHGIDIAVSDPSPNLIETDILKAPIGFRGMRFDIVVAQGVFEYVGEFASQKFAEIRDVLRRDGNFILTYQNFGHRQKEVYWPYSNIRHPADFRRELSNFFKIDRMFPGAHNWNHSQPNRRLMKVSQAHLNINVPGISPVLAVDYLYICSPLRAASAGVPDVRGSLG